ncbi:MFS transporter [Kribbella sp. CWNU-51]
MSNIPNKPLILSLLAFAQLIIALDYTIVYVAVPDIGRELGFAAHNLQWVISGYAVAFGGFLLLGGRMSDLLGRRRMFTAGLLLYGAASLAGPAPCTPPRPPGSPQSTKASARGWPGPVSRSGTRSASRSCRHRQQRHGRSDRGVTADRDQPRTPDRGPAHRGRCGRHGRDRAHRAAPYAGPGRCHQQLNSTTEGESP